MKRTFVVAALLISAIASADTVQVEIRQGVVGKQFPAFVLHILEPIAGFRLQLKRSDGKDFDIKGGGAPGVTRTMELEQPEGKFHYEGELSVNMKDGEVLSMPLQFDTSMFGPLRLELNKDKDVDLEKRTIHFKLNHPAGKAVLRVILDSGKPLIDGEIPFNGEPPGTELEVSWPETKEELLMIELTAYDNYESPNYRGIKLFPYTVYVPHDEIVFDTGKWDVRPDQQPKLDKPLTELKKRIERARPWADVKVYVLGHTDTVGDNKSNRMLSLNRAKSIGAYFRRLGVNVPIFYEGYGEEAPRVPTADNTPEEKNRRADYILSVDPPRIENAPWAAKWQKL